MAKKKTSRATKAGLPPGTLIHMGERKADEAKISLINHNENEFAESSHQTIISALKLRDPKLVSWLNIDGLHDTDIVAAAGAEYNLHPLLLEDILNTDHRPKVEEFEEYLFVSLKMIAVNDDKSEIIAEQLSLVLGANWLVSFQEKEGDVFGSIRERLRENKGLIRQKGADYLLYRLIDTVVDHYFYVVEFIGDKAEELEKSVLESTEKEVLLQIQQLKRDLMDLKKSIYPLRDIISTLQKEDNILIQKATFRYLRDVY